VRGIAAVEKTSPSGIWEKHEKIGAVCGIGNWDFGVLKRWKVETPPVDWIALQSPL
jgi:hypothetical protein